LHYAEEPGIAEGALPVNFAAFLLKIEFSCAWLYYPGLDK
jgi:hypothetical protein